MIVEVRDHKKPIDVRYIEEVSSKKQSVGADAAFIISRSGFTKTALEKANYLGIQTLTYEEALKSDWSGWIRCEYFRVIVRKFDNILLGLIDDNSKIINVAPEIYSQVRKNSDKVLLGKDGKPITSFYDLADFIIKSSIEKLCEGLKAYGGKERRSILYEGPLEPPLFVLGSDGLMHKIGKVLVEADFYIEERKYPIHLSRYRKTEADESIAEVATADIELGGEKIRIDIIAPRAGDYIPAGSKVQVRTTTLNNKSTEKSKGG